MDRSITYQSSNGLRYFLHDNASLGMLSGNPNAIHLLEANPNKINWNKLSSNPNALHLITQIDYRSIKTHICMEELIAYLHPPESVV